MSSGSHKRRKGQGGERELIKVLKKLGYPYDLYRGDQGGGARECDVEGAPHFRIEAKRRGTTRDMQWNTWWKKALEDAEGARDDRPPVVAGRVDHGEWLVQMKLTDLMAIVRQAMFPSLERGQ